MEETELLLKDLTHREIVLEIFKRFGVRRSRKSVLSRCHLVKKILRGGQTHREFKMLHDFIEKHKLTLETFRPFDYEHMYGFK